MSDIVNVINGLGHAIERLEAAAAQQEQKLLQIQQQELFPAATIPQVSNSANTVDPSMIANKLDSAIEKVERMLREG